MKYATRIFLFMAVTMAFLSCTDNIDTPSLVSTEEVSISSATFVRQADDDTYTKAPLAAAALPNSRKLILSASHTPSGGSSSTYFTGITFTKPSGATVWSAASKKYYPISGTLDFLAYSVDDTYASASGFGVTWNSNSASSFTMTAPDNSSTQCDIVVGAKAGQSKSSSAFDLSMSHAQALLSFTAKADVAYNSSTNAGVSITSIVVNNAYFSGTLTATRSSSTVSCAWSSLGSKKTTLSVPGASADLGTTAAAVGSGLMLPGQTKTTITVNYTLHNGKDAAGTAVNLARSYTFTPSANWAAGSNHTYAISFSMGEISVSTSLSAWANASQGWFYATGNATSFVGANFPFTAASLSNMWWRLSGSDSYEPLTYVEGTWGSSVKLEATSYYVTVTKSGSSYTVSYESKKYLHHLELRMGTEAFSPGRPVDTIFVSCNLGTSDGGAVRLGYYSMYAVYSDNSEVLLKNNEYTTTCVTTSGTNPTQDYSYSSTGTTQGQVMSKTGTYTYTFSYTDNITKTLTATVGTYIGHATPDHWGGRSNDVKILDTLRKSVATDLRYIATWNNSTTTNLASSFTSATTSYGTLSTSGSNKRFTANKYAKYTTNFLSWGSLSWKDVFGNKAGGAYNGGYSGCWILPSKYITAVVLESYTWTGDPNGVTAKGYINLITAPGGVDAHTITMSNQQISLHANSYNVVLKFYYTDGSSVSVSGSSDLSGLENRIRVLETYPAVGYGYAVGDHNGYTAFTSGISQYDSQFKIGMNRAEITSGGRYSSWLISQQNGHTPNYVTPASTGTVWLPSNTTTFGTMLTGVIQEAVYDGSTFITSLPQVPFVVMCGTTSQRPSYVVLPKIKYYYQGELYDEYYGFDLSCGDSDYSYQAYLYAYPMDSNGKINYSSETSASFSPQAAWNDNYRSPDAYVNTASSFPWGNPYVQADYSYQCSKQASVMLHSGFSSNIVYVQLETK